MQPASLGYAAKPMNNPEAMDSKEGHPNQRVTRFPGAADFQTPAMPSSQPFSLSTSENSDTMPPPQQRKQSNGSDVQGAGNPDNQVKVPQDWAYDASRLAARNAMQQAKRISFHKSTRQKRKQKPFAQTLRPGIKVDTSVSRHQGSTPKEIFPQRIPSASIADKTGISILVSRSDTTTSTNNSRSKFNWWSRKNSTRKEESRGKEMFETPAPTYELDETAPHSEPYPGDNRFHFEPRTFQPQAHVAPTVEVRSTENQQPRQKVYAVHPQEDTSAVNSRASLNPNRTTLSDISPSDRPITIGISVSPEMVSEHEASPVSGYPVMQSDTRAANRDRSASGASATTPNIMITPANGTSKWTSLAPPAPRRARPTSSIYSRATNGYMYGVASNDVPPVPVITHPAVDNPGARSREDLDRTHFEYPDHESQRASMETSRGQQNISTPEHPFYDHEDGTWNKKERVTSGDTLFEEDEKQPYPSKKPSKAPPGLYIDTEIPPTPRRSRGWWNIITTPFDLTPLRRHFSPGSERSTPDVPILPAAATFADVERSHERSSMDKHAPFGHTGQTPASASTVFSPSTWEHPSPEPEQITHKRDDLGMLAAAFKPTTPYIERENSTRTIERNNSSSTDKALPAVADHASQPGPAQTDSSPADPQPGTVYINNHHYYGFSRQESTNHRAHLARSDTSLSSDTTPVVAVASMGQVLNARSVNEQQVNHEMPRSFEHAEVSGPPQRGSSGSRSAPSRDTVMPYFAPPPAVVYHHGAAYGPEDTISRGTVRSFPTQRNAPEKKEKTPSPWKKGAGGYWHLFPRKKKDVTVLPVEEKKKKKSRRCCCCCLIFLILLIILLATLLGVLIPRSHHSGSTSSGNSTTSPTASDNPSDWLNLTGFPPIPTGKATVARPDNSYSESGCVSPQTMWSCAVPKEEQEALEPNDPDQPNFEFKIQFVNGTVSNTTATQPTVSKRSESYLRKLFARDAAPTPSPAAPSVEDQTFLGNTTDGNSEPFAGEETPFFITFLEAEGTSYRRLKRSTSSSSDSNSSTSSLFPAPALEADGTAAPANLLAFPSAQRLRLYNRGQSDEHYGFYTYFDRSIFLRNNIAFNSSDTGEVPADKEGGSTKDAARVRCTWRDTRFRVQIWTNSGANKVLLPSASSSSSSTATGTASASSSTSTAADFTRPGTFPLPLTLSLDRHGGNISQKEIYCYGIDDDGQVNASSAKVTLEQRAFGGVLVNPAQGPYGDVNVTYAEGGPGGIDGGTGGCGCGWRNWVG